MKSEYALSLIKVPIWNINTFPPHLFFAAVFSFILGYGIDQVLFGRLKT